MMLCLSPCVIYCVRRGVPVTVLSTPLRTCACGMPSPSCSPLYQTHHAGHRADSALNVRSLNPAPPPVFLLNNAVPHSCGICCVRRAMPVTVIYFPPCSLLTNAVPYIRRAMLVVTVLSAPVNVRLRAAVTSSRLIYYVRRSIAVSVISPPP